jgi:hypothetical protein
MDSMIAAMQAIRNDIEAQDEAALEERLGRARRGWDTWWKQRQAGDWINEAAPSLADVTGPGIFGRLLGGMGRRTKNRK